MKEFFDLVISNFKHIKFFFISIFRNRFIIAVAFSLITIGFIKFDDILQTFYKAPDLIQGRKYMDRLIALGIENDGSCTEKAQKARREIRGVSDALYGIISAHKKEKAYSSLDIAYYTMFAMNSIQFCHRTEFEKNHHG